MKADDRENHFGKGFRSQNPEVRRIQQVRMRWLQLAARADPPALCFRRRHRLWRTSRRDKATRPTYGSGCAEACRVKVLPDGHRRGWNRGRAVPAPALEPKCYRRWEVIVLAYGHRENRAKIRAIKVNQG